LGDEAGSFRLLREGLFKNIWIQPAAGDAGGALGAALMVWHVIKNQPRAADGIHDRMQGSYLGPAFDESEIEAFLQARGYPAEKINDLALWADRIADLVVAEQVIGDSRRIKEFSELRSLQLFPTKIHDDRGNRDAGDHAEQHELLHDNPRANNG